MSHKMLRLRPTVISVTIAEVNAFELHQRYKNYLARNTSFRAQAEAHGRVLGLPDPDESIVPSAVDPTEANWVIHHARPDHDSSRTRDGTVISHRGSTPSLPANPPKPTSWDSPNSPMKSSSDEEQERNADLATQGLSGGLAREGSANFPEYNSRNDAWSLSSEPSTEPEFSTVCLILSFAQGDQSQQRELTLP